MGRTVVPPEHDGHLLRPGPVRGAAIRLPRRRIVLLPALPASPTSVGRGGLPLWEPREDGGTPLLGNPVAAVLYPGKLIYAVMPYAWAARVYVIAHIFLAFAAMRALLRSWGVGAHAASIGGLSYAFAGPILFNYCNVTYLVGASSGTARLSRGRSMDQRRPASWAGRAVAGRGHARAWRGHRGRVSAGSLRRGVRDWACLAEDRLVGNRDASRLVRRIAVVAVGVAGHTIEGMAGRPPGPLGTRCRFLPRYSEAGREKTSWTGGGGRPGRGDRGTPIPPRGGDARDKLSLGCAGFPGYRGLQHRALPNLRVGLPQPVRVHPDDRSMLAVFAPANRGTPGLGCLALLRRIAAGIGDWGGRYPTRSAMARLAQGGCDRRICGLLR